MISAGGRSGGGPIPLPGEDRRRTLACAAWTSSQYVDALFMRGAASRSRSVFSEDNLPHVIDLTALAVLAELMARVQSARGSSEGA